MEGKSSQSDPVNIVLIGDGYVGKTSILKALGNCEYNVRSATQANLYDELHIEHKLSDRSVHFKLIDTAGQEEYDEVRREWYKKAQMFVVCFSLADKVSYENVLERWIPEIQPYRHKTVILVGTKLDLRQPRSPDCVNSEKGVRLQKKIGAKHYVECSAATGHGLKQIIDAASSAIVANQRGTKNSCTVQ
ncbi:rho-related protein racC-like [Cylas formicarius]|uniref:rho-related protein racC-like n=1 Tax=Cylas formicarius TaxID=197179 RepID=UPI00295846C7|nr:rho-related protein racC-like [Cylas formicarius]